MSVATQISRITGLRNRIRTKLISLGLLSPTPQRSGGNDLEDCTDAIEGITGTQAITSTAIYDVAGKQYAQVSDANLIAQNIAEGVTILGVAGTHSGSTPVQLTQSKPMYIGGGTAPSTVYPDSGYLLSMVVPTMDATPTLVPSNIKAGATIMGVSGNYGYTKKTSDQSTFGGTDTISMNVEFSSFQEILQGAVLRPAYDSTVTNQAGNVMAMTVYTNDTVGTTLPCEILLLSSVNSVRSFLHVEVGFSLTQDGGVYTLELTLPSGLSFGLSSMRFILDYYMLNQ